MIEQVFIDKYLPDPLKGRCRPKSVHLVKVGFMGLELCSNFAERLASSDTSLTDDLAAALCKVFEKSANVMEIKPKTKVEFRGFSLSHMIGERHMTLEPGFQIRVALSEQQRDHWNQFGLFEPAPEHMLIHYDGSLFFAVTEVTSLPSHSPVGQAAREFIRSVIEQGSDWRPIGPVAPTPIHPDFYLVAVDIDDMVLLPHGILPIVIAERDVIIVYPVGTSVTTILQKLRSDTSLSLTVFYQLRRICDSIDEQLEELTEINQQLSRLLAEFFNRTSLWAVATRVTRRVRRQLSEGHGRLQELSRLEIQLKKRLKMMNSAINSSMVLDHIKVYLNEHAIEHQEIDRETSLKFMDYAASETASFGVTQATVWASVIGAVIGSLMTLLLTKSGGG